MQGEPFVTTLVDGKEFGTLSCQDALNMGLRIIQSAIEAERDAGLLRAGIHIAKDAGDDDEAALRYGAGLIELTRRFRSQADVEDHEGVHVGTVGMATKP